MLVERRAAKGQGANEIADAMIATVAFEDTAKCLSGKMLHQLREHQIAGVNASLLRPTKATSSRNTAVESEIRQKRLVPSLNQLLSGRALRVYRTLLKPSVVISRALIS